MRIGTIQKSNKIYKIIAVFFTAVILFSLLTLSVFSDENIGDASIPQDLPFDDLTAEWSKEYIRYVYDRSLMNGVGEGRFGPSLPLTRGMVVTVLYRLYLLEGNTEYSFRSKYVDVTDGQYYSEAVTWASDMDIVTYTHTDTTGAPYYSPDRNITRQELAVMFFRYAEYKNINILSVKDLSSFIDSADVASWAMNGICWAVRCGLINGTGNGSTLSPEGEATREQFAAIVTRFLQSDFVYMPEHIFYVNKDNGISGSLTGDVAVISIFVSDNESSWQAEQIDHALNLQQEQLNAIDAEADRYSADLTMFLGYYEYSYDGVFNNDTYYSAVKDTLKGLGFDTFSDIQRKVEEYFGAEESAIVFCVNKNLRSFTLASTYTSGEEFAIVYSDVSDAYVHEMCHLFGARDYYIHGKISSSAERNFGECLMVNSSLYVVDSLSAYLMGWTESPLPNALQFLSETSHVTQEEFDDAKKHNTHTGYVTDYVGDGYVYTGNLVDGIFEGYGEVTFDNGDTYVGYFSNGLFHGNGTYRWADTASAYSGEWNLGSMHGSGFYKWKDGSSYEGVWEYDDRHGEGVYRTAYGKSYVEVWEHGTRISRKPLQRA